MSHRTDFEARVEREMDAVRNRLSEGLLEVIRFHVRDWQAKYPKRRVRFICGMGVSIFDVDPRPRQAGEVGDVCRYRINADGFHPSHYGDERLATILQPLVDLIHWVDLRRFEIGMDPGEATFEPLSSPPR